MIRSLLRFLKTLYPAIFLTIFTCILLFSPGSVVDSEVTSMVNDKLAHAILFFGLGFLWNQYLSKYINWPVQILILVSFAVLTEVIQYILPHSFGRSFEWFDILADSLGVLTGIWVSILFTQLTD